MEYFISSYEVSLTVKLNKTSLVLILGQCQQSLSSCSGRLFWCQNFPSFPQVLLSSLCIHTKLLLKNKTKKVNIKNLKNGIYTNVPIAINERGLDVFYWSASSFSQLLYETHLISRRSFDTKSSKVRNKATRLIGKIGSNWDMGFCGLSKRNPFWNQSRKFMPRSSSGISTATATTQHPITENSTKRTLCTSAESHANNPSFCLSLT